MDFGTYITFGDSVLTSSHVTWGAAHSEWGSEQENILIAGSGSGASHCVILSLRPIQFNHARDTKVDKDAVRSLWKALMEENLQHKPLGSWSKAMTPATENHLSFENHLLVCYRALAEIVPDDGSPMTRQPEGPP